MSPAMQPYRVLLQGEAHWRELAEQLGSQKLGARLWRLPPFSANTWHRHVEQDELYFVLEGTGRLRIGADTLTIPNYGAVLVPPSCLRQVFNDTPEEVLWLVCGAPRHEGAERADFYPEDPRQLPAELRGRSWPPA